VWRGGQPTAAGWRALAALGVTNVVKLDTESEGSDAPAEALGMRVRRFPVGWLRQAAGDPSADLAAAAQAVVPGTFVHCLHGQDRTGVVVAEWRVRHGWSKEAAEREMLAAGFHKSLGGLRRAWEEFQ